MFTKLCYGVESMPTTNMNQPPEILLLRGADVPPMPSYDIHEEILTGVHLIRGANRARFPQANALLVDDEVLTLIDAGAALEHIEGTLRDLGHELSDIDQIVLTHFHIDHKGHAEEIRQIAHCDVLCHPSGERAVTTFDGMVDFYGISGHEHFDDWKGFLEAHLPFVTSDYEITGFFEDGDTISCGTTDLIALHTPGHTVDHTCFGIGDTKTIFLVDIDLTRFGAWYGNAVSDISDFRSSIRRIIDYEPEMGISSHLLHPVTHDLVDQLGDYLHEFDRRDRAIMNAIGNGFDTIEKLKHRPTIYPRIPHNLYYIFEEFMLRKHIDELVVRGLIEREDSMLQLVGERDELDESPSSP
ncbi:MBL fold metallo-hydrolase [Candidatus Thorarchaeota archaeon]|nr:MAG: MBL fold metallo-hydrolase [Candidatus Thorarchaeota archaeon]